MMKRFSYEEKGTSIIGIQGAINYMIDTNKYEDIKRVLSERPHQTAPQIASALAKNSKDWDNWFNKVWKAKEEGAIKYDWIARRFYI